MLEFVIMMARYDKTLHVSGPDPMRVPAQAYFCSYGPSSGSSTMVNSGCCYASSMYEAIRKARKLHIAQQKAVSELEQARSA